MIRRWMGCHKCGKKWIQDLLEPHEKRRDRGVPIICPKCGSHRVRRLED